MQIGTIVLFNVDHQGRTPTGQIAPIVLSPISQIKDSTSARDRVSPEAVGNTKSHLI
jgi:hypothetical protein